MNSLFYSGESFLFKRWQRFFLRSIFCFSVIFISAEAVVAQESLTYEDFKSVYASIAEVEAFEGASGEIPTAWKSYYLWVLMHDAYNSVNPRYRTYGDHSFKDLPNQIKVAEAAALLVVPLYFDYGSVRMLAKFKDASKQDAYKKAVSSIQPKLEIILSKYDEEVKAQGRIIAEAITLKYFEQYRANDLTNLSNWILSEAPGQFRVDKTTNQGSNSNPIGEAFVKKFAVCDIESVTKGLYKEALIFDQKYVDNYEEMRCLGRLSKEDEVTELGPNCARTINLEERTRSNLSFEPASSEYGNLEQTIAKIRGYDFVDAIRYRALVSVARLDSFFISYDVRYKVNHWRPFHAIRNGLGESFKDLTIEQNWTPNDGYFSNFPEYPSASTASSSFPILSLILNESGKNDGEVGNLEVIDGVKVNFVSKIKFKYDGVEVDVAKTWKSVNERLSYVVDNRVFEGSHFRTSAEHGALLNGQAARQIWNSGMMARIGAQNDRGASFLNPDGSTRFCSRD